ncbi:MAG: hypothetical protein Q4C86_03325 [bacterium]|nr:hypothetical protein [bacterium]
MINWNRLQFEEGKKVHAKPNATLSQQGTRVLNLSFTSGFGESVHPDVIYVENGFVKPEWKYLMTITPFPCGIVYFENPEFLVSRDGLIWDLPTGGRSPVVSPPSDWIGYNSDPVLLYDGEEVRLIYREVRNDGPCIVITVFAISTSDGVTWSASEIIYRTRRGRRDGAFLMSPAPLKMKEKYVIWYVNMEEKGFVIRRSEGADLFSLPHGLLCKIYDMPIDLEVWHIDVTEGGDRLIMAICACSRENMGRRSIIFAESFDSGKSWRCFGDRLDPDADSGENSLYKAALAPKGDGGWLLYYSCQGHEGHWFTVVKDVSL